MEDRHSDLIDRNRHGIIRGASSREAQGVVSRAERDLIEQMALDAPLRQFRPLLMVIPHEPVGHIVKAVGVKDRARTTSEEYVIENLQRHNFDILQFGKIVP